MRQGEVEIMSKKREANVNSKFSVRFFWYNDIGISDTFVVIVVQTSLKLIVQKQSFQISLKLIMCTILKMNSLSIASLIRMKQFMGLVWQRKDLLTVPSERLRADEHEPCLLPLSLRLIAMQLC